MDDLISRQAAIDMLEERLKANGCSNVALVSELNRAIGYLMQLPSAQPNLQPTCNQLATEQLDIIVCADCKNWICHDRRCTYWNHGVKPLEWCCHAERRTDE